jgi:hypothetical protein
MKLYLSTPDIEAAYQELKAKGVEPTSEIADDGWGKWFGMSDPDGKQLVDCAVVEPRALDVISTFCPFHARYTSLIYPHRSSKG